MGRNKKRRTPKIIIKPQGKGQEPLRFEKGGLHKALGVPQDQLIPESREKSASAGRYDPKARTQAIFTFLGALAKGGGDNQTAKKARVV